MENNTTAFSEKTQPLASGPNGQQATVRQNASAGASAQKPAGNTTGVQHASTASPQQPSRVSKSPVSGKAGKWWLAIGSFFGGLLAAFGFTAANNGETAVAAEPACEDITVVPEEPVQPVFNGHHRRHHAADSGDEHASAKHDAPTDVTEHPSSDGDAPLSDPELPSTNDSPVPAVPSNNLDATASTKTVAIETDNEASESDVLNARLEDIAELGGINISDGAKIKVRPNGNGYDYKIKAHGTKLKGHLSHADLEQSALHAKPEPVSHTAELAATIDHTGAQEISPNEAHDLMNNTGEGQHEPMPVYEPTVPEDHHGMIDNGGMSSFESYGHAMLEGAGDPTTSNDFQY